jgi:hypothetical protein
MLLFDKETKRFFSKIMLPVYSTSRSFHSSSVPAALFFVSFTVYVMFYDKVATLQDIVTEDILGYTGCNLSHL